MTGPLGASRVARLPRASHHYRPGRVCSVPGCSTVLSIYNKATTCFEHTRAKAPRLRGHKPAA